MRTTLRKLDIYNIGTCYRLISSVSITCVGLIVKHFNAKNIGRSWYHISGLVDWNYHI